MVVVVVVVVVVVKFSNEPEACGVSSRIALSW